MSKKVELTIPSYIETETITFEDGNWWSIYIKPTRGMRKQLRSAGQRVAKIPYDNNGAGSVDPEDSEAFRKFLLSHPDCIDMDLVDDTLLLIGTSDWSFDVAITTEGIDSLPNHYPEMVLITLKKHFEEETEENLDEMN